MLYTLRSVVPVGLAAAVCCLAVLLAGCASGKATSAAPSVAERPIDKPEPEEPTPHLAKPPKGAVVLFDGQDASGWVRLNGKPCPWKVEGGALVCVPRSGSIMSKERFRSHKLHIEFRTPYMPDAPKGSQARGNSGVFLQGRYEVQVLDSYDIGRPIQNNDCGALYSKITPKVNACLPPKQWQSYDITFIAPTFGKGRKLLTGPRLTVVHNGITIIDNAEIPGTTPGGIGYRQLDRPGPLLLQDHGNTVAYRNIWAVPIE